MAVDDHGIEAIRKAIDELIPGRKDNYIMKIRSAFNVGGQVVADTVTAAAAQIDTTPLVGRQKIYIQNLGNQSIFLGFDASVTVLTGLEIPKGFMFDDLWGETIPVFLISTIGTQTIRFLEVG